MTTTLPRICPSLCRMNRSVCKYDMRFEFQGNALEDLKDTQDLCELGEYTITE